MASSEPAATKLWEEQGYTAPRPYNYIVFHEPNGGAGDDSLQSDESTARMRVYQPGVSGTPDHEWDGGYVEQGGMKGTVSTDYDPTKQAMDDSGKRAVQPVKLEIKSVFTGDSFAVFVNVTYLGTGSVGPLPSPMPLPSPLNQLNAHLYVFMVEDNVTAYSSEKSENARCHNVFRGYAVNDEVITLEYNKTVSKTASWKVPQAQVPIRPFNVSAVAVIYDDGDTSSQRGADGNAASVPRALNSADPWETAYDLKNSAPAIGKPAKSSAKDGMNVTVPLTDPDKKGIASAFIFYNTGDEETPVWTSKEMRLYGGECQGDVCGIGGAEVSASAIVPNDAKDVYVLAYDGDLFSSTARLKEFTDGNGAGNTAGSARTPGFEFTGIAIGILAAIALFRRK
jgi:hypothetical protein